LPAGNQQVYHYLIANHQVQVVACWSPAIGQQVDVNDQKLQKLQIFRSMDLEIIKPVNVRCVMDVAIGQQKIKYIFQKIIIIFSRKCLIFN
jgi:hypothetical protein